jgi:hypothetical protein
MRSFFERPPIPRSVALTGTPWRPARIAQGPFVEVRPQIDVKAPISIELGGLPLSIGLFAGSGLVFLVRTALPGGWPQTAALVGGSALAVAGVVNLVLPKAEAKAPAAAPPAPSAPVPGAAPAGPPPFTPSEEHAFQNVTGRIASPADFSTVDIGPFAGSYPVRIQLYNPAQVVVTLELEFSAEEDPEPIGGTVTSSLPVQVTLPAGQVRDVDVNMPISSWGALVDYVDVVLTVRKRRRVGEPASLVDARSFVVE